VKTAAESQRFVLIGHPVAHSLSPVIHRAAYQELELSHRYELVDCPDEAAVVKVVDALRSGEIAGANVTIPWKRLALKLADMVAPSVQRVGVANVLARGADGAIVAHNTDVPALVEEFQRLSGCRRRRAGRRCGSRVADCPQVRRRGPRSRMASRQPVRRARCRAACVARGGRARALPAP